MGKNSYKRLLILWLPLTFLFSTIIAVVYLFAASDAKYLHSFPIIGQDLLLKSIDVMTYAMEISSGLVFMMLLGSFLFFLVTEIFAILRLIKLKRVERSSFGKAIIRLLIAQPIAFGALIVGFILMIFVPFGITFAFGYIDMKLSVKDSLEGAISDDAEIIKHIKTASSRVNIYDSIGEFGVVLAKRDYQSQDKLSPYKAIILPLVAKSTGKDNEGRSFFVPETNSVVYTDFHKGKSDKIIIELAFNHLRHDLSPVVANKSKDAVAPSVLYLDDKEYAPFVRKKQAEIGSQILSDLQQTITDNENVVKECKAIDIANAKLEAEQASEYKQYCTGKNIAPDCAEFTKKIETNKRISQESATICKENQKILAGQYAELTESKQKLAESQTDTLEEQKSELSNGMYFSASKTVYMRIIPEQDSFTYLSTLIHELLHHYSNGGNDLPVFINEGLTDYLAMKNLGSSDYEIARNSAYTTESQVAMALLEKIPEADLISAYINNDQAKFESLFKKYFPNASYKEFLDKGENIFRATYGISDSSGAPDPWELEVDNTATRDMRSMLGLSPRKFSQ